jgi:hypothetical protein
MTLHFWFDFARDARKNVACPPKDDAAHRHDVSRVFGFVAYETMHFEIIGEIEDIEVF